MSISDSYWGTFTPTRRDNIDERAQVGDWDGDFQADVSVWRPSTGEWWFHGVYPTTVYGELGDIQIPGDYNRDGRSDIAVWRPSTGEWWLRGAAPNDTYGLSGDVPVASITLKRVVLRQLGLAH